MRFASFRMPRSLSSQSARFSCHASSTEIGGSSPDTNDYVDHIGLGLSGQDSDAHARQDGSPTVHQRLDHAARWHGGGASAFLDLTDTPTAFGTPGQIPAVNAGSTALEFIDAAAGVSTTTNRQRIEALAFTAVGDTTTQLRQQTLGATPSSVVYGTGALEMVTATAAATTFTIVDAGVYLMEWNAVITPSADRPEPCLRVLDNSDDSLLGETDPIYIRASSEGDYAVTRAGILVVPADNTVVKAVVLNCRNDNSFSVAAGHSLHIVRGALGAAGQDGGGGGTDTNDYVDAFTAALTGQDLVLTIGRTGALGDIEQTVTFPTFGGGGGAGGPFLTELASGNVDVTGDTWPTAANSLDLTLPDQADNAVLAFKVGRQSPLYGSGGLVFIEANDIRALSPDAYGGTVTNRIPLDIFLVDGTDLYLDVLVGRTASNKLLLWSAEDLLPVTVFRVASPAGGMGGDCSAYLPLTGGTLTGPGRLTIDVDGNNEALVINHHGGLSESALHAFTNTTGAQKAIQASRSGQSTAFFSIEGSLGGGNTKPGIAFGGGTGARDTELYRDSANNWKTPDFFTAQGFSITGTPLTTWNALGIGNVLDGPPTLVGSVLTFTELDGTATDITLPAGGGATDRYVTGIITAIDSSNPRRFTIQLTRNDGLPTLTTTHTVPHETPADGDAGYLLGKATAADRDFEYIDPSTLLTAGTVFPSANAIIEQGTGITITRDAANHAIRIASDTAPWALIANTDVIVPGKLGSGVTSPDVALFGDGAWKTLPSPLDDISDWAHRTNFDVIPAGKLGTGTTDHTTILYGDSVYRVPDFLTAAGVYDWAEEGNVDRLPIDKMPSVLRTVNNFSFDTATRQLAMFFTNTVGISVGTQVILPDFLTAADVTAFDIHDVVTTPANIQAADRFIFSDESVAGDPMRYARADALVPYVLGHIADSDIPGTLTRDSEVENFALLAHPTVLVGYDKMTPVVRSLSAFHLQSNDPPNQRHHHAQFGKYRDIDRGRLPGVDHAWERLRLGRARRQPRHAARLQDSESHS